MKEKILTKHPTKSGRNINKDKYDLIKKLKNFKGSINWYVITVQKDLEARKTIKIVSQKPKLISSK